MKFNIEVDTTPEEVRRLMGLPDLSEVHDVYLEKLKAVADKGLTPDMVQGMIRNWVPMGDQSMDFIKSLMGAQMALPEPAWNALNWAWSGFFAAMGLLNLWVAFNFDTDTWVNFKLFGGLGLVVSFIIELKLSKKKD